MVWALNDGHITYSEGSFRGKFDTTTSKELRSIGATFDRKTGAFRIAEADLPPSIRIAIATSTSRFREKIKRMDETLAKILPAEIAGSIRLTDLFEKMIVRFDKDFEKTIKGLTIAPSLTDTARKKISEDWQSNMDLWIKDFTQKEIENLREKIKKSTFSGNRYETMVKTIKDSYGVTRRKAKFLARQETNLLLAKFKETRYTEANINEYIWTCVKMPKDKSPNEHVPGNVRYSHGILDGLTFRWDDPPITTPPGEPARRNNPGQDYNCRCFARPIVKFGEKK